MDPELVLGLYLLIMLKWVMLNPWSLHLVDMGLGVDTA